MSIPSPMRASTALIGIAAAIAVAILLVVIGPFGLILIAAPTLAAALFAAVLRVPEWWIAAPGFLLAVALLISGFFSEDYDIGRSGAVLIAGVGGSVVLTGWLAGVRLGRTLRRSASRQA